MAKRDITKIQISFVDSPSSEDVTGSMVLITTPNHNILLDAGMHQSNDRYEDFLVNNRKFKGIKPKEIDLIFISHNHADHSLATPRLFKLGCEAGVIMAEGSKLVSQIMGKDCAEINERDILVINSQKNKNYQPLFGTDSVQEFVDHILEYPYNKKIKVDDELSFKLIPSGHLLGGCQILLYITIGNLTKTILYTGDIGNKLIENHFVGKFQKCTESIDLLIGESTYGDRPELKTGKKQRKTDILKLKTVIDTQIHDMNGRVIIPTFAQSRCQQLALMIYELYKDQEWQPKVYIDSPLAIEIFKLYEQLLEGEELRLFQEMLKWDNLIFVKESESSKALVESNEPCCVLSTSGMMTVGRIRHHLKKVITDPNSTILFVGYATEGSLAAILKDSKTKSVNIDQKEYKCRCSSYSLTSMSGHAPFNQLIDYYSSINCKKIVLHHGSKTAKETLATELKKELENKCSSARVVVSNSSLKFSL